MKTEPHNLDHEATLPVLQVGKLRPGAPRNRGLRVAHAALLLLLFHKVPREAREAPKTGPYTPILRHHGNGAGGVKGSASSSGRDEHARPPMGASGAPP